MIGDVKNLSLGGHERELMIPTARRSHWVMAGIQALGQVGTRVPEESDEDRTEICLYSRPLDPPAPSNSPTAHAPQMLQPLG